MRGTISKQLRSLCSRTKLNDRPLFNYKFLKQAWNYMPRNIRDIKTFIKIHEDIYNGAKQSTRSN